MKPVVVIPLFLVFVAPVWGRVIHVDQGGGGDVTAIQKGLNVAQDGDTVLVAPGTYREGNLRFDGKAVRLVSEGGPNATRIDGAGNNRVFDLRYGEGPGTIIDGFRVIAGGWDGFNLLASSPVIVDNIIQGAQSAGIVVTFGGAPLIENNIIIDGQEHGIEVETSSSPTIEGNLIYGNGGYAVYAPSSFPRITGNVMVDNYGGVVAAYNVTVSGNWIEGGTYGVRSAHTVVNNVFLNNANAITNGAAPDPVRRNNVVVGAETGIDLGLVYHRVQVENNVIVGGGRAINVTSSDSDSAHIVRNNILVNNEWGVYCEAGENVDLRYNDVWNNSSGDYRNCAPEEGSVSEDPGFAAPGAGHYALSGASPLIDAGDPGILDTDGTSSDMGAYGGPGALPLALTLVPRDTLVRRGEDLRYDVVVTNTTAIPLDVEAWTELILPDRRRYPSEDSALLGPVPLVLGPEETRSTIGGIGSGMGKAVAAGTPITHPIPLLAPAGIYEYSAHLGAFPGTSAAETRFYFVVLP